MPVKSEFSLTFPAGAAGAEDVRVLVQEASNHGTGIVEQLTQKGPVVWEQRGRSECDCLKGGEAISTAWQEPSGDCSALSCGCVWGPVWVQREEETEGSPNPWLCLVFNCPLDCGFNITHYPRNEQRA